MKIALLHAFFGGRVGGGGGIRLMTELGRGLCEQGHEVVVCCHGYEPGSLSPDPADEFEIRAVRTGPMQIPETRREALKLGWWQMREVARLIPDDVDVINAHEAPGHMAGYFAAKRGGAPVVWTRNDHTLWETALMPDQTWIANPGRIGRTIRLGLGLPDRAAGRAMDSIVVLDSRNAAMVERAYGSGAEIIRSGAAEKFFDAPDKATARRELGIAEGTLLVLGVGILAPYRRFTDLVSAVAELPSGTDFELRIIGSEHSYPETARELREQIQHVGIADRTVLMTDGVSDSELIAHYSAADAFVFPNEMQTWGLAPLEAIACGTPAIVSRGAGVHEVLEGRDGAQIVSERSPTQIADAIAAIAAGGPAADVGETRTWIRNEFGRTRFAERMAELFARLS